MTTLDNTRSTDRLLGATIGSAVSALIGRVADWNDARITRNALSKLSDRELDDIGLTRADLDDLR